MGSINKNSAFNRWIFESYTVTPEGLGYLRIFTSLFLLFFLIPGQGVEHFQFLSSLPNDFYAPPPGPMMLFDGFPGLVFFQLIQTLTILAILLMLIGYRTRWASLLTGISILILQGFIFSIGKIDHEILIALVPIILSFSNWGAAFSIDSIRKGSDRNVESWPLTLLALFIGFMMFTAGFPKILGGWLDIQTQAAQSHLLNQYYVRERQDLLAGFAVHLNTPLIWELLDWGTVLFEIGFLVSIIRASWFRAFICIAVLFHFSTMMTMNIAFLPNFLAYAVFLDWNKVYKASHGGFMKISDYNFRLARKRSILGFTLTIAGFFALLRYLSIQRWVLDLQSDLMLHEVVIVSIGLGVVLAGVYRMSHHLIPPLRRWG